MRCLIIEDEIPAVKRLQRLLDETDPNAEVVATIDSVESAINWLRNFSPPDLIFLDIQLADGVSFDIFEQIEVNCPIIFTTAYDQYMLKAFQVNSVDYLLKPIERADLQRALAKFRKLYATEERQDFTALQKLMASFAQPQNTYRKRFLVKRGQSLVHIDVGRVSYFYSEDGVTFLIDSERQRFALDRTLDELEKELDPTIFFRINRAYVVAVSAVAKIHKYFNNRLKLDLIPAAKADTIVSRDRVKSFKQWLDR